MLPTLYHDPARNNSSFPFLTPQPNLSTIVMGRLVLHFSGHLEMTPGLYQQAYQVAEQAAQHNLALGPALVAPLFTESVDVPAGESVFRFMPLASDPTWRDGGSYYMPSHAAKQMETVWHAGVRPHTLFIGHELGQQVATLPYAQAEAYMRPVPPQAHLQEAHMWGKAAQVVRAVSVSALVGAGALALGAAAAATAGGALVGALALGALALDPVLLGVWADPVLGLRTGQPALWVPLAAWRY